jgi:DNA-binding MarR family transcriptional regulator
MAEDPSDVEVPVSGHPASAPRGAVGIGPALRRAWLGYQHRLDEAMAVAGFDDRKFPDGRILRLCSEGAGSTISGIGRESGMTRQGAGKVVNRLHHLGYISVSDSPTSGREKVVTITASGLRYLEEQRHAVRAIEEELRTELGDDVLASLQLLLGMLDQGGDLRLRAYLGRSTDDPVD